MVVSGQEGPYSGMGLMGSLPPAFLCEEGAWSHVLD